MNEAPLKVSTSKFTTLLVVFSLAFSGLILFNVGFNFRVIHLLLPLIFILTALTKFNWIIIAYHKIKGDKALFLFKILLVINLLSTLINAEEVLSGLKLFLAILINGFLGLIIYGLLSKPKVSFSFIQTISYYSVLFISLVIPIQFFLSALGFYKPHMYGENGIFMLGRPAAFFGDPGWLSYWLVIFSAYVFFMYRGEKVSNRDFFTLIFFLLLALIISQSRVSIALIVFNFYAIVLYKKPVLKFVLITTGLLSIIIIALFLYIGIIEIPPNLYYDIIKLKANPRYYDSVTIINEFIISDNIWIGNGLGSLDRLVETYPWRNYTNSHNILFLQILNDSGLLGILCAYGALFILFKKLKCRITRLMFFQFFLLLHFHNIFPYFQLFWFLLPFIFTVDQKLNENITSFGRHN